MMSQKAVPVSNFLEQKWRQVFEFQDANNDGLLTQKDFITIADNICKATNATDEEAKKTRHEWMKWLPYLHLDPSNSIDVNGYIASCTEVYQDIEKCKRDTRDTASDLFDRIDLNKDGLINLEEFEIFYRACGRTNKEITLGNFSKIDTNGDGYIQRDEFIEDIMRYLTDPDPVSGKAYTFSISR